MDNPSLICTGLLVLGFIISTAAVMHSPEGRKQAAEQIAQEMGIGKVDEESAAQKLQRYADQER